MYLLSPVSLERAVWQVLLLMMPVHRAVALHCDRLSAAAVEPSGGYAKCKSNPAHVML